jgi:LAGLIDADG endonuclease
MDRNQFSLWFSGFIDGEGNFQVFLDRHYLRAIFRIRLHIDDIAILYKIKEFLGGWEMLVFMVQIAYFQLLIFVICKKY